MDFDCQHAFQISLNILIVYMHFKCFLSIDKQYHIKVMTVMLLVTCEKLKTISPGKTVKNKSDQNHQTTFLFLTFLINDERTLNTGRSFILDNKLLKIERQKYHCYRKKRRCINAKTKYEQYYRSTILKQNVASTELSL